MHILKRYASTPFGTFGEIQINGEYFYSVEKPWKGNKPFESCIPLGSYQLVSHSTETHPNTFALVSNANQTTHTKTPTSQRYAILIHPGNTEDDFAGCIGFGMDLGYVNSKWAVMNSRIATQKVVSMMEENDTFLITDQKEGW